MQAQLDDRVAPSQLPRRLPYVPAIDGLRGVAVLAVIAYHADVTRLHGGFLGVEIFFVVSGYLITALLLSEFAATGTIGFGAFWGDGRAACVPPSRCS